MPGAAQRGSPSLGWAAHVSGSSGTPTTGQIPPLKGQSFLRSCSGMVVRAPVGSSESCSSCQALHPCSTPLGQHEHSVCPLTPACPSAWAVSCVGQSQWASTQPCVLFFSHRLREVGVMDVGSTAGRHKDLRCAARATSGGDVL